MLGFGWLALRQAQEALRTGRLEEAHKLLTSPAAQGQRGRQTLLAKLCRAYVARAERQLRQDDSDAAWRDLLQAEQVQPADPGAENLRQALTRLGATEIRAALEAGDPARARDAGLRLRQRAGRGPELDALESVFRAWLTGRDLAEQGQFPAAVAEVDRVRGALASPNDRLARERAEWEQNQPILNDLQIRLLAAGDANRWREVLEICDQVLRLAPQHPEARRLRQQAWKMVEPVTTPLLAEAPKPEPVPPEVSPRFLLWIDGVGGFLLCLGNRLTLGQAVADNPIEIPLVADVSRMHATLTRDSEGYLLEALRSVKVNNQDTVRALLRAGDRITLGSSCQLVFQQAVPVSTTARLNLASGHRLPLALDGVILMGETILLGPGSQAHVIVPELHRNVVLFRHRDSLGVRADGSPLTINGQGGHTRAILAERAVVQGEDVSFAVEPVGPRLG
jgi:tetratricopeptide (TPR) repeat protein